MAMNLSGFPRPFNNNPNPSPTDQAQYLRQLIQATGSDQLKRMMTENQMSDEEVVQFVMEHPEEVRGAQGQGTSFAFASSGKSRSSSSASSASSASASSSSSSLSASLSISSSAPADSYSPSEEDDSEGDADLQAFSQDETMAAPSMCAMGGVTSADKAKPEMQQNLKECKAISKALAEMQKQDSESNPTLSIAVSIVVQKEQILRSCLKRGKGAADEAYKSQGIDPKDEGAVSAFVAKIGKEIMDQGISCGLEIEVSEKRADRLKDANGGGGKADEKGKNGEAKTADKTDKADKKDKVTTDKDKDKDKNKGVGKGEEGGGDDDDFKITTKKTDKQIEVGVDEIQGNPAMSGAIMEQLTALWDQKQQEGDGFKAPQTLDLGVTKKGSPLDQAFTNPNQGANGAPQQGQSGMPGMGGTVNTPQQGQTPGIGAANPGMAPMAPAAGGKAAGGAPRDLRRLMAELGMTGKKFNAKVQVYEPNAQVTMTKAGGGGVKVNGELKGKAISIKTPKMIGRAADGTVHKLGSLQRVGNNGSFMAAVKGDATGAESASKQLHTSGDGSISIPGAKAN